MSEESKIKINNVGFQEVDFTKSVNGVDFDEGEIVEIVKCEEKKINVEISDKLNEIDEELCEFDDDNKTYFMDSNKSTKEEPEQEQVDLHDFKSALVLMQNDTSEEM